MHNVTRIVWGPTDETAGAPFESGENIGNAKNIRNAASVAHVMLDFTLLHGRVVAGNLPLTELHGPPTNRIFVLKRKGPARLRKAVAEVGAIAGTGRDALSSMSNRPPHEFALDQPKLANEPLRRNLFTDPLKAIRKQVQSSSRVKSCRVVSSRVKSRQDVSCRVVSCQVVSSRVKTCQIDLMQMQKQPSTQPNGSCGLCFRAVQNGP